MTVKELLDRIDSAEITEWAAYEQVYGPLGGQRDDYLTAQLAATIANGISALGGKRGTRTLADVLLKWDQSKRRLLPHEMLDKIRALNQAFGGKEVDKP